MSAAFKGRAVIVRRNGVVVAGARVKGISIAGAPVDITTDDDAGWRKVLEAPGQLEVSLSISGIVLSEAMRVEAMSADDRIAATQLVFPGPAGSPADSHGWSGDFFLSNYSENAEYQNSVTFEAELISSGPIVYTPQ